MIKLKISLPSTDKLGLSLFTWEKKNEREDRKKENGYTEIPIDYTWLFLGQTLEFLPDFIFLFPLPN